MTGTLETKHLNLVNTAHLIDTSIKSLEDINSGTNSMNKLIESASLFAKILEVDSMSHFKTHILTRKAPNRLDKNTNNQIEFTMKLFYRKEFKNLLDLRINLAKNKF